MIDGTYWACSVHAPKATPLQRLTTAIEMASMRLRDPPRRVVVRPETAAELGQVELIEVVARDGLHRDLYLFPLTATR